MTVAGDGAHDACSCNKKALVFIAKEGGNDGPTHSLDADFRMDQRALLTSEWRDDSGA